MIHGPGARLRWKPRKKTTLEQGATTVRYKREYYYECEEEDEAIKVVLLYQKTTKIGKMILQWGLFVLF